MQKTPRIAKEEAHVIRYHFFFASLFPFVAGYCCLRFTGFVWTDQERPGQEGTGQQRSEPGGGSSDSDGSDSYPSSTSNGGSRYSVPLFLIERKVLEVLSFCMVFMMKGRKEYVIMVFIFSIPSFQFHFKKGNGHLQSLEALCNGLETS